MNNQTLINQNIKLTVIDSNKDLNGNDIFVEVIINEAIIQKYLLSSLTDNSYCKNNNINLTPRELEVMKLVALGKTNTEIAKELIVSVHTAKAHVCNILAKLNAKDRTKAVVYAIKYGLLDVNSIE